ncbi:MAG: insulinase family protein [Sphaerochaetaceae bacterium]
MEQERTETAHLAIGDEVHGFLLESIDVLEDYHGYGYFYRHRLSGMEVYHVANDDRENFFAFMFKTPPDDDCGTPHIIEHSILAGSKRYPVRDPFMSLLKGSVNTFMNAMTYPDYTVYPAASVLPKDYKNLFAVYADAVFNPLLAEKTFWQEGIRTVAHEDGSLSFDGVVFNEMLGDLSDHDSIVARLSTRSLFPDTPYFYESGGDPSAIISLSYSQFLGYYSTYYHPSNCRLLLYGNQNAADQLQLLEQLYVQDAYRKSGSGATAMAKAWNTPRTITATSLAQEQTHNDATVAVSWATTLAEDPLEVLSLSVITDILLGNPGAPLYKAIIDSNLATDISQVSGMDANFKQMPFVVGAKGVDPKNSAEFSDLVFATLKELVEKGIPLPLIRNAIRRQEFAQQEISSDVPMGLRAMNRAARSWLQGKKPHTSISVSSVLSKLKALVEETVPQEGELLAQGGASKGPEGYLEQWITTNLLNNPHRILLIVKPDPSHNKRLENAIEQRLEQLRQQLGDKGLALLKEQHQQFVAFENSEDSEQDLATIPRLSKEDLPQSIRVLKQDFEHVDNVGLYLQPMESNGIIYLDGFFSVAALGGQQQLLLPLFVRLLHMCNVADMGYEEVAVRIRERTGGLYFFLETSSALNNEQKPTVAIGFRLKALQSDARQALDLLSQILSEADLSDTKRIKVVIQDLISDYISNVGSAANMFASQRASAQFSPILAQNEQWNGIDQWLFLQEIDLEDQNVLTEVGKQLQQMKQRCFRSETSFYICVHHKSF